MFVIIVSEGDFIMEFMQTEHLNIRRMRPEDWSDLFKYLSDPESQKYQNKGAYTKKECIDEIYQMSQFNINWTVCLKSNNMAIGFITLQQVEPMNSFTFKLHFNFDENYLVNGFVKEANERMIQHAFEELGAHRVIGLSCASDTLTNKEYGKLQMRKEALFQKAFTYRMNKFNKPIFWDICLFAILKDEWVQRIR